MSYSNNSILSASNHNFEIIDIHAHIYPDKIAKKAVAAVGDFYNIPMDEEGTASALISEGRKCGANKYVVHSVATTPAQTHSINNFIKSQMDIYPEFIGFSALHPDSEDFDKDFEQMKELGLSGIKLHPDFQKFYIDNKKAFEIYKRAEGKYPILFHMGDARYDFSEPIRLKRIKEKFPNLTVIAAHFGGYQAWDKAKEELADTDAYFDTSSSLYFIDNDYAVERIHEYGVDRMLFGTDFPMWNFTEELNRFFELKLTDEERVKILSTNAKKLLKLD